MKDATIHTTGRPPTVAARLTPRGRGAVATIAVRGDLSLLDPFFRPRNGKPALAQRLNQVCFGKWGSANSTGEEIVACRVLPDCVEIHCHGGPAAVSRLLKDLASSGAEIVPATDFAAERLSTVELECESALAHATTERTALALLEQRRRLPAAVRLLLDLPAADREAAIRELLVWSEFGTHLTVPWKVVLCGRANVGKSSLINRLVGYHRAVVFDEPGTTRDLLAAQTAFAGWPVELIDTAGQRDANDELEAAGILNAQQALQRADLALLICEAPTGWTEPDRQLLGLAKDPLVVWNKLDLVPGFPIPQGQIGVSARTGDGLGELVQSLVDRLVPETPPEGASFPVTAGQAERLKELCSLCRDDRRWQTSLREWAC